MLHRASGQWLFIFHDKVLPEPATQFLDSCADRKCLFWERQQHGSLHVPRAPCKSTKKQKSGSGLAVSLGDPTSLI